MSGKQAWYAYWDICTQFWLDLFVQVGLLRATEARTVFLNAIWYKIRSVFRSGSTQTVLFSPSFIYIYISWLVEFWMWHGIQKICNLLNWNSWRFESKRTSWMSLNSIELENIFRVASVNWISKPQKLSEVNIWNKRQNAITSGFRTYQICKVIDWT